jgi:hypothetical protein
VIILKTNGIFNENGTIVLNSLKTILWENLSNSHPPQLPGGTSVEVFISFDENILLSGINGIVWATYDKRQAEIIQNTLLVQNFESEINRIEFGKESILTIKIIHSKDINEVIDFIWKSNGGLRLKPDWTYPEKESNKSFELWLSGR